MSLRTAVNQKCRQCTHDPKDKGSAAQQIACCTIKTCGLYPVRPITCKSIPARLLEHWHLCEHDLCDRARHLVESSTTRPVEGQFHDLQPTSSEIDPEVLVEEDAP